MNDVERLPALIGDIYDAALDPGIWHHVLTQVADLVGGQSAALLVKNPTLNKGGVQYDSGGMDSSYKQAYFERYVSLDPTSIRHLFAKVDEPIATEDLLSHEEMRKTRFFREWAAPQRLVDCLTTVLEKTATSVALFGVLRHERHGIADAVARRWMRQLSPHVRRAMLIGRTIDRSTDEAASLADVLDGLSAGLFLVDEAGSVVHANAAGRGLLDEGRIVRSRGGRLATSDPGADQALRNVLSVVPDGDAAVGVKGIALPLAGSHAAAHVAHVLPLTSGARRQAGREYNAKAAIFVREADAGTRAPAEMIAETYRLTPTELRVLLGIVDVGGVPEVADALGVADETVKTHLKRLYGKTGTSRQADLVKVVARFANPLLS